MRSEPPIKEAQPRGTFCFQERSGLWRTFRITSVGWAYIGLAVGVGIGALNTGNNLLYLLMGMLCAFIVSSGILSEIALRKVEFSAEFAGDWQVGQPANVRFVLRNTKRHLPSYLLRAEALLEVPDYGCRRQLAVSAAILDLPAGKRRSALVPIPDLPRRGRVQLQRVSIETVFPFSFLYKARSFYPALTGQVLPRVQPFALSALQARGMGESTRSRSPRGGEAISHLRFLQHGDTPRHIHWLASARQERFVVREFEQERRPALILRLLLAKTQDEHALEAAIENAASCAAACAEHGIPLSMIINEEHRIEIIETALPVLQYLADIDQEKLPSPASLFSKAAGDSDTFSIANLNFWGPDVPQKSEVTLT